MMFCLNGTNDCSATTLSNNFMGSLFHITGALNFIVSDIVAYANIGAIDVTNKKELAQAQANFQNLGEQIGLILRTITGYTGTVGHPIKPITPPSI